MKDTIKAKYGYRVIKVKGKEDYYINDGWVNLFRAQKRSYEDYMDEKRQNEMFRRCEVFTTVKGNQFIYWRDEEIDTDYITKVNEDNPTEMGV